MMMERIVVAVLFSILVPACAALLFVFVWLGIFVTGQYHYDYRCRDGVTEQRAYVANVPFGGWDPVSGQSVIAPCQRKGQ